MLQYQSGFGNHFATEALPGALPAGRNSPQRCAYGLYAEQFSGTAFTAPRHANRRSWLYRIRPAAVHGEFQPIADGSAHAAASTRPTPPNPLRWDPLPIPAEPTDFLAGPARRWAATARPSHSPAAAFTGMPPTARCRGASSTTPTESC